MSEPAPCEQCQAILEEIRRAGRESHLSPQHRDELRAFTDDLKEMGAGSGEGVDALLAKFPFRFQQFGPVMPPEHRYPELHNPAMCDAIRKMVGHRARTGHKVSDLLFRK
jgi:hypothetical protein